MRVRVPDTSAAIKAIDGKDLPHADGFVDVKVSACPEMQKPLRFEEKTVLLDAPFTTEESWAEGYEKGMSDWTVSVFEMPLRNPEMSGRMRRTAAARLMYGPLVLAKARAVGVTPDVVFAENTLNRAGATVQVTPLYGMFDTWGAWRAEFSLPNGTKKVVNVCDFATAADHDDASNAFSLWF